MRVVSIIFLLYSYQLWLHIKIQFVNKVQNLIAQKKALLIENLFSNAIVYLTVNLTNNLDKYRL